MKIVELIY